MRPVDLIASGGPIHIIRYAYYAFIFSVPFESVGVDFGGGLFSLTKLIGLGFILTTLIQPRLCWRPPPRAFWWFGIYIFIYAVWGAYVILDVPVDPAFPRPIIVRLITLVQLLVLFWMSYSLMRFDRIVKGTFVSLAGACIILAVLQELGITSHIAAQDRVTFAGVNPNSLAVILSAGLLALVGLAYGRTKTLSKARWLFWLSSGVLGLAIVRTGSRGAMIALVAGFLVLWLKGGNIASKLRVGLVGLIAVVFLGLASYQIEAVRVRWERTILEGDQAGRQNIHRQAWQMFKERPLAGWGPVNHYYELGYRRGEEMREQHNLYLWVLNELGLLGAVPFFIALGLCWHAAWKARGTIQGALPMAMIVNLFILTMKSTIHNRKYFWIILAYAAASSLYMTASRARRRVPKVAYTSRQPVRERVYRPSQPA